MYKMLKLFSKKTFRLCFFLNVLMFFSIALNAQNKQSITEVDNNVKGTVTSISGEPLIGVSVMVKGTTIGTVTDINGTFSLKVPESTSKLRFTYIGYNTVEIKASKNIKIQLEEATQTLEDVVVVGYGTQKKTSLTASVGLVKGKDVTNKPVSNLSTSLAGRVSGLLTAQSSGEIGNDQTNISIRGISTTGNSSPLIVVDGVPRNTINQLDPNTVESVTVLKDAAAVAPYGMGGANGVILITTKQGKLEKPQVSYNGFVGFQNPTTIMKMMNSYQYVTARNAAMYNQNKFVKPPFNANQVQGYLRSVNGDPTVNTDIYPNTNAFEELRNKNTPITNHNMTISGGNEFIKAFTSLGYQYQEGMWSTANSKRFNLTTNVEMKATKTTTIGVSLNAWTQINKSPGMDGTAISSSAIGYLPTRKIYYSNGYLSNNNGIILDTKTGKNSSELTKIMTQITLKQDLSAITKGLDFKVVGSYDPTSNKGKSWGEPRPTYYDIRIDPADSSKVYYDPFTSTGSKNALYLSSSNWKEYTGQLILNYNRTFGEHSISGLLVGEARSTTFDYFSASRINYDFGIDELNYGGGNPEDKDNGGSSSETKQVGYVFRGTYNYAGKYMVELSGRYDGHYYFAPGHRFGFFPAASLGWRISEEKFIKDNASFINNLKLRASYGQSGNLAGGPFQFSSSMSINPNFDQFYNKATYVIDGKSYPGVAETIEPNPSITWEKANKLNIGLDANLWNGLFEMQFDYFYERRDNMLVTKSAVVPAEYAIPLAQVNAGVMDNAGVDFSITTNNRINKKLSYNAGFNFTYARNKLIETYENPLYRDDPNRSRTGKPLFTRFGLKSLGLFQVSDFDVDASGKYTLKTSFPTQAFSIVKPGDIRYADVNGDNKITTDDETNIGFPAMPEIVYGFTAGLNYSTNIGTFDFNLLIQGTGNSNVNLGPEISMPFYDSKSNVAAVAMDWWTPDNTDARFPRILPGGGALNNQQISDFYMRSNAYIRLKNVEIGYTLPKSIIKFLTIQNMRIYYSGQNLYTYAPDLVGLMDPEMGADGVNTRGWVVPQQKVHSIGLSINF